MPSECGKRISRSSAIERAAGPARAAAGGQRRPFADPVGGEDRRFPGRRGEEGGGGVRLVMLGEQDLAPGTPSREEMMPRTQAFSPSMFFIACGKAR